MKLLDAGVVYWGLGAGVLLIVLGILVAPLAGLEPVSVLAGLMAGMIFAVGYLMIRGLKPVERALLSLETDDTAESSAVCRLIPGLIENARTGRTLVEALSSTADANAVSAAEVSYAADQLKVKLDQQVTEAGQVTEHVSQIMSTVRQSAEQATGTTSTARHASRLSLEGRNALTDAIENIRVVHRQSSETLGLIEELNGKSEKIQSVTAVIEGIAAQTNLLALNAAIEAARAGEQGRGFAVVADEVRQLAGRTAQATGEVADTLQAIRTDTGFIVTRIKQLAESVENGLQSVESVGDRLGEIQAQSDQVESQVLIIAEGDQQNEQSLEQMGQNIEVMHQALSESDGNVQSLASQAARLMERTEQINAVFALNSEASYHQFFYHQARRGAEQIRKTFEEALEKGQLTEAKLFSNSREAVPGTSPQKYRSGYDQFTDEKLPVIQESVKKSSNAMVYSILTAPDGYVPTHNKDFAHSPTGDPAVDLVKSRSKRLFNDRTGIRCGSHTQDMLLQTYRRDTGEIMHDLSVPVYVKGRHWGGFRLGYRPDPKAAAS